MIVPFLLPVGTVPSIRDMFEIEVEQVFCYHSNNLYNVDEESADPLERPTCSCKFRRDRDNI
jgi:hypothetical protein